MRRKSPHFKSLGLAFALILLQVQNLPASNSSTPNGNTSSIPLSLTEALRMAKERHVEVIVANERVQQAIARIAQARAPFLPQLEGDASEKRQVVNLNAFGINIPAPGFDNLVGPFNSFDARINLTQTLFDAEVIRRLQSAKAGKLLSLADSRKTEEDVLALVADLYLNARRAEEKIQLARTLLAQAESRLRIARSRSELGLGTSQEVIEGEAEQVDRQSQLTQSLTEAKERRYDLAAALGLEAQTPIQYSEEHLSPVSSRDESLSTFVNQHPDVELARKEVDQKKIDKKVAQAAYYPKLWATANYGASGTTPGDAAQVYQYGGQLQIPLYQGGLHHARVREATSEIRESEARMEDTKAHTEAGILSAKEGVNRAYGLMKSAEADFRSAQKQYSLAQERLKQGTGTELEVVDASSQLASAKDKKMEAQATYDLAKVALAHALGRMESLMEK
jgi:outer membrane protein TolC